MPGVRVRDARLRRYDVMAVEASPTYTRRSGSDQLVLTGDPLISTCAAAKGPLSPDPVDFHAVLFSPAVAQEMAG